MRKFLLALVGLFIIGCVVVILFFPEFLERHLPSLSGAGSISSSNVGAELMVPKGWSSELRSVGTPALVVRGKAGESVVVSFQRTTSGTTLDGFVSAYQEARKGKLAVSSTTPVTVGETEGRKLVGSDNEDGKDVGVSLYFLPVSEKIYTIRCSAPNDTFEEVCSRLDNIAESVKLQ